MRENRQFMSMKNNAYSNGDTDQPPQNLHNLDSIFLHRDNPPIDRNSNRMTQSYIHPNPSPDVPIVPATLMNNNESSIQSATTEQDTTIKYISILDKINDNQMKKNKFYSDIIKDIDDPQDSSSSHLEELDSPHRMIRDEEFRSEGRNWGKSKDRHRESRGEMTGSEENGNNNNIDHILEIHQPNHNEIIFECSKEWTVNQTPDMREKDSIPLHIQQHLDKMRPIGSTLSGLGIGGRQLEFLDTCDERQSGSNQKRGRAQAEKSGVSSSVDRGDNNSSMYRSRAHRLNCQKELFGSK